MWPETFLQVPWACPQKSLIVTGVIKLASPHAQPSRSSLSCVPRMKTGQRTKVPLSPGGPQGSQTEWKFGDLGCLFLDPGLLLFLIQGYMISQNVLPIQQEPWPGGVWKGYKFRESWFSLLHPEEYWKKILYILKIVVKYIQHVASQVSQW